MAEATTDPVRLPSGPGVPSVIQGLGFVLARHRTVAALAARYGSAFTVDLPMFGKTVVISDAALVKDLFTSRGDAIGMKSNLGAVLGPGSSFSLDGEPHRQRRKLLVPPFNGKRMQGYERIVEEEVMREIADWPEGKEFATLQPMMRITLSAILRAVFGAEGAALDSLREILPPWVTLGSRLAVLPLAARRDLGSWSPGGRLLRLRRRYDEIIDSLIADALADPLLDERTDVLSLMLQARYEDGSRISNQHVADELLTLLTAGHETTANTLAWTVERLRRHPRLLARLTDEVDAGGSELRQATIWEVQRTRPVVEATIRRTRERIRLGEWVIPEEHTVMVSISLAQASEENFQDAATFDPDRFLGKAPENYSWIPFGGGVRRCIGAAFANMEMTVTLRTLLREFEFVPTDTRDEPRHSRGVATAPGQGGRAVVRRRQPDPVRSAHAATDAVSG